MSCLDFAVGGDLTSQAELCGAQREAVPTTAVQPEADHGQGHHKWKQEDSLQLLQPHAFIYVFTVPH